VGGHPATERPAAAAGLLRRPAPVARGVEPWDGPAPDDPRPDAVLFDMDGALLDTGTVWASVVGQLVRAHGGVWLPEDDATVCGRSVPALSAEAAARGVPLTVDEIGERLHASVAAVLRRGLPWRPGALTLLVSLRRAGVRCALVTATHEAVVRVVLAQAPDGLFAVVVTGDGSARPEPAPDGYLLAAQRLRVDPQRCAAVEDSPAGVRAALGAGALTYAVDPLVVLPDDLAAHPRLRRVDGLAAVGRALLAPSGW
jgi:HAD superfamily hydrolase (TIGR01509 family)